MKNLRGTAKNRIIFILILSLVLPITALTVVMSRAALVLDFLGDGKISIGLYDMYFADYSEDPNLDTNRMTLKILIEVKNPHQDQKVIIPRVAVDLEYDGEPVGKIWIKDELILEPFINNESDSAGLLTIYASLYVGGTVSGLPEMLTGLLSNNLDPTGADVSVYLGDFPIDVSIILGQVAGLLGGGDLLETVGFDIASIFSVIGFDLSGGELSVPVNHLMLYNTSVWENNKWNIDIRAMLGVENRTILTQANDRMIFGTSVQFNSIYWANGTDSNSAHGNGTYTWQYWNGNTWADLPTQPTFNFTESGLINLNKVQFDTNWKTMQITDFFPRDYYYIQCKVDTIDTCVGNLTVPANATFITMDVNNSVITGAPAEPSSSGARASGGITPQQFDFGGDPSLVYPELDILDIPIEKGLFRTDMELTDYLLANGIDFNALINDWVIPPIVTGLTATSNQPSKYATPEDYPQIESIEDLNVEDVLGKVLNFLLSHQIELTDFLIDCQFDFEGIFNYLGENFIGWTAPNGIDIVTGDNIYDSISDTARFQNSITYSMIILLVLIGLTAFIVPYFAQKKVSQQFIFKDIKNLDTYMDKVKKEMEIGVTQEEIDLLKTVSFKKKSILDTEKKGDKIK